MVSSFVSFVRVYFVNLPSELSIPNSVIHLFMNCDLHKNNIVVLLVCKDNNAFVMDARQMFCNILGFEDRCVRAH